MDVKQEFIGNNLCSTMASSLHEPLMKVEENKIVASLNIQEIVEDNIDTVAYDELNIKQEELILEDLLLPACAGSESIAEEQLVCKVCGYKSEDESNFTKHVKTPTKQFYLCSICENKGVGKYSLVAQKRTHIGEKRYSCSICKFKATQKQSLVIHMRIHSGEKPYWCSICEYKTARRDHLVKHMKRHTGEKPYSCSVCEYKTARRDHLVNHMKRHTGEKPYSCSVCEYKTARGDHLAKHMKRHSANIHVLIANIKQRKKVLC